MMKSICRFCLYIFIVLFLFPFSAYTQASGKKFVVVIDAGHGGKDPGAIRAGKHGISLRYIRE